MTRCGFLFLFVASLTIWPVPGHTTNVTGSLLKPRTGHTATLLASGSVLVVGGSTGFPGVTNTTELYDPLAGMWTSAASLAVPRIYHTATLLPSGKVLIV